MRDQNMLYAVIVSFQAFSERPITIDHTPATLFEMPPRTHVCPTPLALYGVLTRVNYPPVFSIIVTYRTTILLSKVRAPYLPGKQA